MSDGRQTTATKSANRGAPDYLGWRGDLLAQLALARIPRATVFKPLPGQGADYLVATDEGLCFFVVVQAYSSARRRLPDVSRLPELEWTIHRGIVSRARRSHSAVILFLFDADTEHGRFLRLDTLPGTIADTRPITLRLPIENTINRRSLTRLLTELGEVPST